MIVSLAYVGMDANALRQTLETLARVGWKATFFVDPPSVLNDVALWHAVAAGGHEIGNAALQGVTLSGELLNWTVRMVEQDLHMTQSFLEDEFEEKAVPVFLYPGPFTRCSDGDYRSVIQNMFDIAIAPGVMEQARGNPEDLRCRQRVSIDELSGQTTWTILRPPDTAEEEDALIKRLQENRSYEVLPVFLAATRLGLLRDSTS